MRANVLRVCAPHVYCGSRRIYVTGVRGAKCGALLRVVSATRVAIPQQREAAGGARAAVRVICSAPKYSQAMYSLKTSFSVSSK